jgi:hypothetical protein
MQPAGMRARRSRKAKVFRRKTLADGRENLSYERFSRGRRKIFV